MEEWKNGRTKMDGRMNRWKDRWKEIEMKYRRKDGKKKWRKDGN